MDHPLRVAILGSGNIGTDLLMKICRSSSLECTLFIGRNQESLGLAQARAMGVTVSDASIQAIVDNPDCCDLVFDATSAEQHIKHDCILKSLGKRVIDMTPSCIGATCVPAINLDLLKDERNINMVSCGGQASIPIAYAIAQTHSNLEYIEVVSSIASLSAGAATRVNVDEYIETTESALSNFTGCSNTKALLILNPAQPPIRMQTTISAKVSGAELGRLRPVVADMVATIQRYVPGYEMVIPPVYDNGRIFVMVRVSGLGDYLPPYAGNLDIISCAAIAAAEDYACNRRGCHG